MRRMCEGDDVCWTLVSALCVRVYAAKRCHGVGYCVLYYTTEPPCSVDSHAHVLGLVVSSVSGTPPQGTGTAEGRCVRERCARWDVEPGAGRVFFTGRTRI